MTRFEVGCLFVCVLGLTVVGIWHLNSVNAVAKVAIDNRCIDHIERIDTSGPLLPVAQVSCPGGQIDLFAVATPEVEIEGNLAKTIAVCRCRKDE